MRLRYAMVADFANVTNDGKLNVMGVTDRLFAYQFPAVHRELYVIDSLETDNEDDGTRQEVAVQVIDPDGRSLAEIRGHLDINGANQTLNQIHCFQDIQFATAGAHQVNIILNGHPATEMRLELIKIEQAPEGR